MSSSQAGNVVETLGAVNTDGNTLSSSHPNLDMGSTDVVSNIETDFQLSTSDIAHGSPRDRKETSVVYRGKKTPPPKKDASKRPTRIYPPSNKPSSSIPLPVKSPKSSSPTKVAMSSISMARTLSRSRPSSVSASRTSQVTNKHTLEIQFINKRKRLSQLKKDLLEKQKPVLDLYQNLVQIKKRLEDLGKVVHLEEVKLLPFEQIDLEGDGDAGDTISPETVRGMQDSIEDIPKTLMDICKNLLSRRAVIVDLLDSVAKTEIPVGALGDKVETLKSEGMQLQKHLDAVINDHEKKIAELITNWEKLIHDRKNLNTNCRIEDLEDKLRAQERLTQESNQVIMELQRKLDDKRCNHDKSVSELNTVIHTLKDQMLKLEQELDSERKAAADYKSRSSTNAHNSKVLRNKIAEIENEKKASDAVTGDLNRKLKVLQEQLKHKEAQWAKEKEDLSKNLKHQENLLQKLNADKNKFETRLEEVEGARTSLEEDLQNNIEELNKELDTVRTQLVVVTKDRDEAAGRCRDMEDYISKMGVEFKETMHMVSNSIEWGKDVPGGASEAQKYSQSLVKDIMIRECQDKIKQLEKENNYHKEAIAMVENIKTTVPTETEKAVLAQHDIVSRYKQLLAESEQKLTEKSHEVAKLTSEIRQLKVRQEHLEEINQKCPAENLQRMVEEGRQKLSELMKKSLESEQRILHYENVIDKQSKQMNEMENLLRYRENMAGVLKASRDELVLEKESLTRYSHEMRTVLAEVSKEGKMKDRLIKELQEKIDLRERQINKLEKEVKELEANLMMTNEKRFKLQETIGSMEKELQSTKAHVNQLADINTRTRLKFVKPF